MISGGGVWCGVVWCAGVRGGGWGLGFGVWGLGMGDGDGVWGLGLGG